MSFRETLPNEAASRRAHPTEGRSLGRRKTEPEICVFGSCVGDQFPDWKMRGVFY